MDYIIQENLKTIIEILSKEYNFGEDILEKYTYEKIERCCFYIEDQDKTCNKRIKNKKFKNYCEIHFKLKKMLDNMDNKNENINDYSLTEYDTNLFVDVFNNVFKLENNQLIFYGAITDGELCVNK